MANKKKTGTSLVKWDAKLAELASRATKTVASVGTGGNMIKTQGGRLNYQGADIPGNKMRVIVLAHVLHNAFYEGAFDADNPTSPICYAFGAEKSDLVPHEQSPKIQHDQCEGCPQNEWGSANTGRGKACANKARLALISESDLQEDIAMAELAFIHVPVTSVKAWAGYVRQLDELVHRPPLAFVTEISLTPDPKNQFNMLFMLAEQIEDGAIIEQLIAKAEVAEKEITFPYPEFEQTAAPKRGAKGRNVVPPRAATKGRAAAAGGSKKSKF